ncbi:BTAD domain-containing putative transcriptional regulator [Actinokineospora spheciospongiae]|uniref:BTAD domain-containing putative transcriptional regulator n=1 Tax=Actinokineospora spheciospongiae TaxID=909613 RepID=UPI001F3F983F|nr:BTAD domain-containing putative transcriptional regulator [Actinokineospora spheciospongiae]
MAGRVRSGAGHLCGFLARVVRGGLAAVVLLALLVGMPWALTRFVGWPLPDHLPSWAQVQSVLLGPMTTTFLLDILACLCWITWAAFTLDLARCAADLARGGFDTARLPELTATTPVRALTGVLLATVLLAVSGNRAAPAASSSAPLGTGAQIVAGAAARQHPPAAEVVVHEARTAARAGTVGTPVRPESVLVLAPRNGIHDSLWRIAARTLGDGARWPDIFELNKGKPQPNGRTLTTPSLIFPGEELALPREAHAPVVPPQQAPNPGRSSPAPPATSAPPVGIHPSTPVIPAPPTRQTPPATTRTNTTPAPAGDVGFRWGAELYVGFGLIAAISAALLTVRRRHRARYRPGSGDRDDLPVAPVVYRLRLAHLRTDQDTTGLDLTAPDVDAADHGSHPSGEGRGRARRVPPPPLVVGEPHTGAGRDGVLTAGLGVRDGREIALDLATARGLGLLGPGAVAAARALLLTALTTAPDHRTPPTGQVVVAADDLAAVLGREIARGRLPSAVRVTADLDAALDAVEAETLVRASTDHDRSTGSGEWPPLLLVARPPAHPRRLQAVLDNGAPFAITGLLLGQWQPGVSAYVRENGTISTTSPGIGEGLRGTRMFHLSGGDTTDLLDLLRHAEPDPPAAHDRSAVPPAPRPRRGAAHPAGKTHRAPQPGNEALSTTPPDTALEITSPPHHPPPGPGPRRTAAREIPDHKPAHQHCNQVDDEPTPTAKPVPPAPATPAPAAPPTLTVTGEEDANPTVTITVLGGLRVHWHRHPDTDDTPREITEALQPRTQELLVLLSLHPDGVTRDRLVSALWSEEPPARPTNALHTALSRMRHALATATDAAVTDIVSVGNGRYRLDPATVRVDYHRFARAVAARRAASTDAARITAYREVIDSYGGPLAEGMEHEWIEPAREAIRRDAIDAVAALARALIDSDPHQTLDLLEIARSFDPHNELLYRDIMRLQQRLGQLDAIPRTLTLLTTRLAEIDTAPTPQAHDLATRLAHRHNDNPTTATTTTPNNHGHSAAG